MSTITTEKLNNYNYRLFSDKKCIGTVKSKDGKCFTYEGMDSLVLREIADKLDKINNSFKKQLPILKEKRAVKFLN